MDCAVQKQRWQPYRNYFTSSYSDQGSISQHPTSRVLECSDIRHMSENRQPNLPRIDEEDFLGKGHDHCYTDTPKALVASIELCPADQSQKHGDPLSALVPVVVAGATCVMAKLFHKQHKQQKHLKAKQGVADALGEHFM